MDFSTPRGGKRARSDSASSTSSTASTLGSDSDHSTSSGLGPYNKILRSSPSASRPAPDGEILECNLPPTCFPESRTFGSSTELDRHQLAFHTYICRTPVRDKLGSSSTSTSHHQTQARTPGAVGGLWDLPSEFTSRKGGDRWKECRKVFPDQRLLDLHHCECHDRTSRNKQNDGLPIFQCFIPPPECTRVFITPKQRRHHLINKHRYPEQYFFGITNHGLNRIAEEEGLGASLIRPRREYPPTPNKPVVSPHKTTPGQADSNLKLPIRENGSEDQTEGRGGAGEVDVDVDVDMDELTKGMSKLESSLSFVPSQVRRKAKGKAKAGGSGTAPMSIPRGESRGPDGLTRQGGTAHV